MIHFQGALIAIYSRMQQVAFVSLKFWVILTPRTRDPGALQENGPPSPPLDLKNVRRAVSPYILDESYL